MNYAKIDTCSMTNGDGMGVDLFVSGCSLCCRGCFNKKAQDPQYGQEFTEDTLDTLLDALKSPYIERLSILGGDPLEPYNKHAVEQILKRVRDVYGDTKRIWLWTGRTYEDIKDEPILDYVDVLIDGKFELDKKEKHAYHGSSNQRVFRIFNEGSCGHYASIVRQGSPFRDERKALS